MPFIILSLLIQVSFAVHVIRTGRDTRWIYLIIMAPMIGCLIYFFAEIFPTLGQERAVRKLRNKLSNTIDPGRTLRERAENLKVSNNVENVVRLAEACLGRKLYDKAILLYQDARKGIFQNDPVLMLGLARAYFEQQDYAHAKKTLDDLIATNPDFKSGDGHLLYAKSLEALNEKEAALHEYDALVQYNSAPEAKCRYALLLKKNGNHSKANALFGELLLTARQSPRNFIKSNRHWIDIAGNNISH